MASFAPLVYAILLLAPACVLGIPEYTRCPSNPLDYCDFYFQGYLDSVPIFELPEKTTTDTRIGTPLREKLTNRNVTVASNSNSSIVCDVVKNYDKNQFYFSGPQVAYVTLRTYNSLKKVDLENECVVMTIKAAQINEANGQVINLNEGDKNSKYPEIRRCAVFKTGVPQSASCVASPPPPPVQIGCPTDPLQLCDFYFKGYKDSVPSFTLPTSGDTAFSTILMEQVQNYSVLVANSNSSYYCTPSSKAIKDQFYFTMSSAKLFVRSYNQVKRSQLVNKCFFVQILEAQLTGKSQVINLAQTDKNLKYPYARRCAVFKTGPDPPLC